MLELKLIDNLWCDSFVTEVSK